MIDQLIKERLDFIDAIIAVFKTEFEPNMPKRFKRGPFQKVIFRRLGVPITGHNMKMVNEALQLAGYSLVTIRGWAIYKKEE